MPSSLHSTIPSLHRPFSYINWSLIQASSSYQDSSHLFYLYMCGDSVQVTTFVRLMSPNVLACLWSSLPPQVYTSFIRQSFSRIHFVQDHSLRAETDKRKSQGHLPLVRIYPHSNCLWLGFVLWVLWKESTPSSQVIIRAAKSRLQANCRVRESRLATTEYSHTHHLQC